MSVEAQGLFVKSHTARDLLQSAALFKNEHLVVWEYVSNGLEYVDPGINPVVRVSLDSKNKRITIKDNGRGMTFSDLQNFFVMHGENVDRKAGRPGRGTFGTGKSAAFGIAESLTVTTVRKNRRTKVSLKREDVEKMSGDAAIPVNVLEREVVVTASSGTAIEIDGVHLPKLDQRQVIRFVERHLAHWSRGATVWVNNHECEYRQPTAVRTEIIECDGVLAERIGKCNLILQAAAAPLAEDERGVSIFSKSVWHETTLAGSENREMASFIFGEIDIPALADDKSPVRPFDMNRSMQLNPANELVRLVMAFVGTHVEKLRKELVVQERERKASEDAKRLAKQADEIAKVINDDFFDFRKRVAVTRAKSGVGDDVATEQPTGSEPGDDFIFGTKDPAEIVDPVGQTGVQGDDGSDGVEPRQLNPEVQPGPNDAPKRGRAVGRNNAVQRRPRGGFSVEFRNMGEDENRAKYHRDDRQIVINLDHPQFIAALGSGTSEDLTFRRLAYEVAFSEYALALALELAQRNEYRDITDPIVEIGETLNRVARRAASLYQAS
jgi:Histidine kinase-, DNA gyrase B-, and HSP90-like ATPase